MAVVAYAGHESDDFSEYDVSPSTASITTSAGAGLNGSSYGIEIDYDAAKGTDAQISNISFSTSSGYARLGFIIDVNTFAISGSNDAQFLNIYNATDDFFLCRLHDAGGGNIDLVVESEIDPGGSNTVTASNISQASELKVEVLLQRASTDVASDGILTLYVNGTQEDQVTGIDNYDIFPDLNLADIDVSDSESSSATGVLYFDELTLRDDSTLIFPPPFRFLGMAADSEQLYVAGLADGTLTFYIYSDLDSLTEGGSPDSFGSATDSDIDNLAKGIYPVARPGADLVVYLRGRDGSDVHVQKNDLNGGGGWTDLDDGGWGATKFCVALMPDILDPDDLIAAFDDNDVYRAQDDGANWVKMGDAPTNLRTAARHPTKSNELLLAGILAADLHYTHNFGVSFDDVDSTGSGIIDKIEFSL